MARWFPNKKMTVEEGLKLEIRSLKNLGFLECRGSIKNGNVWWSIDEQKIATIGISICLGMEGPQMGRRNFLKFDYTITDSDTGETTPFRYSTDLVSTPCRFGGQRWWFICPLVNCSRRVGVLYLPYGAKYFGCRHCYNLTYESVQTHDKRIDDLIRNPETLKEIFASGDTRRKSLALRAHVKVLRYLK